MSLTNSMHSKKFIIINCLLIFTLFETNVATTNNNPYVPIYLDHNITINHNLNFLNGHHSGNASSSSSSLNGSIHVSSFHTHQKHGSGVHPPYLVADLAKQLNEKLRWIADHEMEVATIQRLFDGAAERDGGGGISGGGIRDDSKLVAQIASRLHMKIENAIEVVNDTSMHILNLYHSYESKLDLRKMSIDLPVAGRDSATLVEDSDRAIYMETMVFPCESYEDDLHETPMRQVDASHSATHAKRRPFDLMNFLSAAGHSLHEHEDLNYTMNSQLLETIRAIDLDVPNFKNAYFLSKDNYGGDSNCKHHYANQHFRYAQLIFIHLYMLNLPILI